MGLGACAASGGGHRQSGAVEEMLCRPSTWRWGALCEGGAGGGHVRAGGGQRQRQRGGGAGEGGRV